MSLTELFLWEVSFIDKQDFSEETFSLFLVSIHKSSIFGRDYIILVLNPFNNSKDEFSFCLKCAIRMLIKCLLCVTGWKYLRIQQHCLLLKIRRLVCRFRFFFSYFTFPVLSNLSSSLVTKSTLSFLFPFDVPKTSFCYILLSNISFYINNLFTITARD